MIRNKKKYIFTFLGVFLVFGCETIFSSLDPNNNPNYVRQEEIKKENNDYTRIDVSKLEEKSIAKTNKTSKKKKSSKRKSKNKMPPVIEKSKLQTNLSAFDQNISLLAKELIKNIRFATPKTPIVVSSFVDLSTFSKVDSIGLQIPETFIHELQKAGLTVVDFKARDYISVTKQGDYLFSRDFKELKQKHNAEYILAGTLLYRADGLIVNARLIGIESKVVVASAKGFFPKEQLSELTTQGEIKDGIIILE